MAAEHSASAVKDMSMEELQAEFRELARQLDPIANRRAEIAREMGKRKLDAGMMTQLRRLTPDQRRALRHALDER